MLEYRELRIRISRDPAGVYHTYAEGPSGNASGHFTPPYAKGELNGFLGEISDQVGRARKRRAESPDTAQVRHFGGMLFDSLFENEIRDLYNGSLRAAEDQGKGLRLTLSLKDVPELMLVPWEFLYDEPNFLAISDLTPVVRYLDLRRVREPLAIQPPLRILGMVSSPAGVVELDVEREIENIDRALARPTAEGAVEVTWLETATLDELQSCLRGGPYHVFHYIGHGEYDEDLEDGVLLLEDERGRPNPVTGENLGATLANHTSLRLAALNSCEGGRNASDDPFAGVATSLVQSQIPAVVAMQFEITDRMASVFSKWLYESLAAGFPIDRSLSQARLAMFNRRSGVEWGTPVLFMRVQDGRIFDVPEPPVVPPPPPPPKPKDKDKDEASPKWWRTRTAMLIAAGVLAALLVAVVVLGLKACGGDTTTSDLWSTESSFPSMQRIPGVAADGSGGAFAVGVGNGSPVVQHYVGGSWSLETGDGTGVMRAVAVSGGTAVAGGLVHGQARDVDAGLWRRTAGKWVLTCPDEACGEGDRPQARQQVFDIAATGATFVAVGRETRGGVRHPALWHSDDAITWIRARGDAFEGADVYITGVAAKGDTVVAVGNSGQDGASWISDNRGVTWTKQTDNGLEAQGRRVEPQAVAATSSGWVAAGKEHVSKGEAWSPVVWLSPDGRTWTRAKIHSTPEDQEMADVARTSSGLVAVGLDLKKDSAAVWESDPTGKDWRAASSSSFSGQGQAGMSGVTALSDGTVLAVGSDKSGGRVWIEKSS